MSISSDQLKLLLNQYQGTNLEQYISAFLQSLDGVQNGIVELKTITIIDQSIGAQLDVIGTILGQSRIVPYAIIATRFGFDDTTTGYTGGFGEVDNPSIGAPWIDDGDQYTSTVLNDFLYRQVLKGKVYANQSMGTIEQLVQCIAQIITDTQIIIKDAGSLENRLFAFGDDTRLGVSGFGEVDDASFGGVWADPTNSINGDIQISFGRTLTPTEQAIISKINLLPRDAGGVIEYVFI